MEVKRLRVFISSPMDVREEREAAAKIIQELNDDPDIGRRFHLEPIKWETIVPPLVGSPQMLVDKYAGKAGDADIVICIFGGRMGTEMESGDVRYQSGTYYEFTAAHRAYVLRGGKSPQILLYRQLNPKGPYPVQSEEERLRQLAAVENFFHPFLGNTTVFEGIVKVVQDVSEFGTALRSQLRAVLEHSYPPPVPWLEKLNRRLWWKSDWAEREKAYRHVLMENVSEGWVRKYLDVFIVGLRSPIELRAQLVDGFGVDNRDPNPPAQAATSLLREQARCFRRKLVLLGSKGSGKTVQLMVLVKKLIEVAGQDERRPIPVVLQFSSFARYPGRFFDWLVSEVVAVYGLPRKLATAMIENGDLLLCLDGIDEITVEAQDAEDMKDAAAAHTQTIALRESCMVRLNTFVSEEGRATKLVLCYREETYATLKVKLDVPAEDGAIVRLLPLAADQIQHYLESEKDRLGNLHRALDEKDEAGEPQNNAALREMAKTLFLFTAMTIAYGDEHAPTPTKEILIGADDRNVTTRRLMDRYIRTRLQTVPDRRWRQEFTEHRVVNYLAKLALHMKTGNQPRLFLLERLQTNWLPARGRWRFKARVSAALLVFMLFSTALPIGLAIAIEIGIELYRHGTSTAEAWHAGSAHFQKVALLLAGSAAILPAIGLALAPRWTFGLVLGAAFALSRAFTIGCSTIHSGNIQDAIADATFQGWLTAAFSIPILGGVYWYRERQEARHTTEKKDRVEIIRPLEEREWRFGAAVCGILIGLVVGVAFKFASGWPRGLGFALGASPFLAWVFGQFGARVSLKTEPNQGIKQSLRNATRSGLILATIGFFGFGLGYGLGFQIEKQDVILSVEQGLVNGLLGLVLVNGMLVLGLMPALQNKTLRRMLVIYRRTPKHFERFLEYAASLQLLRRVGGGYLFEHEFVRDYFLQQKLEAEYVDSFESHRKR